MHYNNYAITNVNKMLNYYLMFDHPMFITNFYSQRTNYMTNLSKQF